MTRYERGFLTKCASSGVPEDAAVKLLKRASDSWEIGRGGNLYGPSYEHGRYTGLNTGESSLAGAGIGAVIGALLKSKNKKERARKAIMGALIGLAGGYGAGRLNEIGEDIAYGPKDVKVRLARSMGSDDYTPVIRVERDY